MILIIDACYKPDSLSRHEFVEPIARIVKSLGRKCRVAHFEEEAGLEDAENIIICGSALKDKVQLQRIEKFSWLKSTCIPVLGICAGMQVIAKVFGCGLKDRTQIGFLDIRVVKDNILLEKDTKGYFLHSISVQPSEGMEVLAEGEGIQAIRIEGTNIYGVQFHPEVRNQQVITNFLGNVHR